MRQLLIILTADAAEKFLKIFLREEIVEDRKRIVVDIAIG